MDDAPPLVSCVMPTADRRAFVPRAIGYFLRQDYPNKELLIVDDGADSVADLVPENPQLRYIRLGGRRTLGAKRNLCVEAARGELIMHWDDDDWMAPGRIGAQVNALLSARADICGMRRVLFFEPASGATWMYDYPARGRPWVSGNTLLYTRAFWHRAPFPDLQVASDLRFIWAQPLERAAILADYTLYVAIIHPGNTSPKARDGWYWVRWPGDLRAIMGADLDRAEPAASRRP